MKKVAEWIWEWIWYGLGMVVIWGAVLAAIWLIAVAP